jgi:hypothetical protein
MISNTKIWEGMEFENSWINYVLVLDESNKKQIIWLLLEEEKKIAISLEPFKTPFSLFLIRIKFQQLRDIARSLLCFPLLSLSLISCIIIIIM